MTLPPSAPLPRLSILCLEDDRLMATAIQFALRDHDVVLTTTTRDAMAKIDSHSFDAWLLDVALPDGSGIDVLSWARGRGHLTPALVMTGQSERDTPNIAQVLGAEFIYKPYSKANLEAFLRRSLQSGGSDLLVAKATRLAGTHKLTTRETEVLVAFARGVSRRALTMELGVKENTLKSTIRRLLRRTGHPTLGDLLRTLLREP